MTLNDSLLKRALTDSETGLPNEASLRIEVERAIEKARRYGFPLSMVTILYEGEDSGTRNEIGRLLGTAVRRSDCIARVEDGEFRLLLTHDDAHQAPRVAERLREVCQAVDGNTPGQPEASCRIVVGSQAYPLPADPSTPPSS